MRGFNLKGIGPRSGGKIQVRVFKIRTNFVCPPFLLQTVCLFFSYSTYNPSDKTFLEGLRGFHHGVVYMKLFF